MFAVTAAVAVAVAVVDGAASVVGRTEGIVTAAQAGQA